MAIAFVLVAGLWFTDNKIYVDTMNAQLADGYVWNGIKCREPNKDLPYISIKSPNGKEYVCNKLEK